jgi:hypothetical protein
MLREVFPSSLLRFFPAGNARDEDGEHLMNGAHELVRMAREGRVVTSSDGFHARVQASDGSFTALLVVGDDPDTVFEMACAGSPGVELPGGTQPTAMDLVVNVETERCSRFCLVTIHAKRDWQRVERAIMKRVDEKASQLNRLRRANLLGVRGAGVVWIDHPALVEASAEELEHVRGRLDGRLASNRHEHFSAAGAIVLSSWRTCLSKTGEAMVQARVTSSVRESELEQLPFIGADTRQILSDSPQPRSVLGSMIMVAAGTGDTAADLRPDADDDHAVVALSRGELAKLGALLVELELAGGGTKASVVYNARLRDRENRQVPSGPRRNRTRGFGLPACTHS